MQNISLNELFELFMFRWKWLVAGLVCGALVLGVYTGFFVDEKYMASVSVFVQNEEGEKNVTTSDLHASRMLTNSYAVVLKDAVTLRLAAERSEDRITASQISRALSVVTSEDSAVITLRAVSTDAVQAQAICQAVANVAPEIFQTYIGKGSATPLDTVPPAEKIGPNLTRNIVIGGMGGLLLAGIVIFILHLTDTTIRHKEDLRRVTELPLLGEIPALQSN